MGEIGDLPSGGGICQKLSLLDGQDLAVLGELLILAAALGKIRHLVGGGLRAVWAARNLCGFLRLNRSRIAATEGVGNRNDQEDREMWAKVHSRLRTVRGQDCQA